MGRGQGRRRRRSGDKIALRQGGAAGGAGFGFVAARGGRGIGAGTPGGAAEKNPPLSPREQALLNQARGPGIIVTSGLPSEDKQAIQSLSVRKLIKRSGTVAGGAALYKATSKR